MAVKDVVDILVETGKQVGSVVSEKAREAGNYAKDAAQIASLKNQISTCRDMINKNYVALGEYYYKKYEDNPEAEMVEVIRVITNAENTIKELEDKIQEIKDAQVEYRAAKETAKECDEEPESAACEEASENIDDELAKVKETSDDADAAEDDADAADDADDNAEA